MTTILSESNHRLYEMLYRDLGEVIRDSLDDSDINEIMLNPDGRLWVDSVTRGLVHVGEIPRSQAFSIVNDIAGIQNSVVTHFSPRIESELPFYKTLRGERFTAQIPPLVSSPCFTLRKRSDTVFTLDDYALSNRISLQQLDVLKHLVAQRKNILIAGGPGSGKTTVTNALICQAVKSDVNQRFVILEDLPELQCAAPNCVSMLTSNEVNMTGLLRSAMRMRPDRILIGEVRGGEALDMLKAWNTGCPGGICTVHANGAEEAIQRILDLVMEVGISAPPIQLVLHTIDAVVSVSRKGNEKGFISEVLTVKEHKDGKFVFEKLA